MMLPLGEKCEQYTANIKEMSKYVILNTNYSYSNARVFIQITPYYYFNNRKKDAEENILPRILSQLPFSAFLASNYIVKVNETSKRLPSNNYFL